VINWFLAIVRTESWPTGVSNTGQQTHSIDRKDDLKLDQSSRSISEHAEQKNVVTRCIAEVSRCLLTCKNCSRLLHPALLFFLALLRTHGRSGESGRGSVYCFEMTFNKQEYAGTRHARSVYKSVLFKLCTRNEIVCCLRSVPGSLGGDWHLHSPSCLLNRHLLLLAALSFCL
jgi:hypothetical protein